MNDGGPEAAALRELLERGVRERVFPAAAAWVAVDHRRVVSACAGAARPDTLWDTASLTKPMVVVSAAMRAVASGVIDLDERVRQPAGLDATVRALLGHRAGLPPWDDLTAVGDRALHHGWEPGGAPIRAAAAARIGALAGTHPAPAYSDLGFIALGWWLERRLGRSLRQLAAELAVGGFGGVAPPPDLTRYLATGDCARRGGPQRGVVDDLNCWALGGAAGHAGIFATADQVGAWALDMARAEAGLSSRRFDGGVVRDFWDQGQRVAGSTWVLGWDTPTPGASTAGARATPSAVGHLGFTGTSVWLDRDRRLVIVLLSNRVAMGPPSRAAMRGFRPDFHDAVGMVLDR